MSDRKHSWKDLEPPLETDGQSVELSHGPHTDTKERFKYGKYVKAAIGLFEEYCHSSTVHGVRYFTEKKRHWMERVWWMLAIALALFYCGYSIQKVYIKWDQSPVIVSFAEKSTPVWEIPFPAVTICPETKANTSQLNFTDVFNKMVSKGKPPYNITDKEDELMAAVIQICDSYLAGQIEVGTNFTDSSITDLLRDTAPSSNDTFFACKIGDMYDEDCQPYFHEIMTEDGLCFTFNTLNGSELFTEDLSPDYTRINHNMSANFWNLEDGYNSSVEIDSQIYPYRIFGSGAQDGIYVQMHLLKEHLEYMCRGAVQGFKISLHTPGEIPQMSKHYFRVPLLQEVLVSVKPNMITTSEGLRHYEPNRRQCYFASERKLRFLKMYTQRNCELECLANFTLKTCGCVKFSMPRDKDTPICGAAKMNCYLKAGSNLLKEQFAKRLTLETGAESVTGCNCLPACTSITYDAEISQAPFDWKSLTIAHKFDKDFPDVDSSQLWIYFKENQFITSKRSELFGPTDFLASCGGLLGLFMGASFLSIVELLYFLSLRLWCNLCLRMHRKRKNKIVDSAMPGIVRPNGDDKME